MKRWFVLLLVFVLFLSSCAKPEQETVPTIQPETVPLTEPIPETTTPQETVCVTTVPAKPLHSDLYHPDYTLRQIQEYFEEVVLDAEFSDGTGDSSLVQKWMEPIGYRIYGNPTDEDRRILNDFFAQLNRIPGFPGFYTAEAEGLEMLRIHFLEPDVFRDSFSAAVNGEDAYGAMEFWYYTDTNEIYAARIGYRTDLDQMTRSSILLEEIVNMLGISDTLQREDSITYQYSNENLALSEVDWILLKLLYHPEMQCGLDARNCAAVIKEIYY